jgi:arylsulfatase
MRRALLFFALAAIGCRDARVPVYTDVLRVIESRRVEDGKGSPVDVWDIAGERRPTLVLPAPGRVAIGPLPAGSGCELHFGLAIDPMVWPQSQGIRFRMSVAGGDPFFDETLGAASGPDLRWRQHAIRMPAPADAAGGSVELTFETLPVGGDSAHERAGWGAPYVVCTDRVARRPPLAHPHVILISIDTLRADHLGTYGYRQATSPVIDALARESVVFDNAFATASWTLPSHASMLTGLYPDEHLAGHHAPRTPLRTDIPTLAEVLASAGYRTIAFTGGGIMTRSRGLDRGFALWTERFHARLDAVLPEVFVAIGAAPERPFFLFLHSYDVHGPYPDPPPRAPGTPPRAPDLGVSEWMRLIGLPYHHYQAFERYQGLDQIVTAYDDGIRSVDDHLRPLFEQLQRLGLYDDALVIVTSDHGESLYERGVYVGHSYTLYDEELHVPLLVRVPRARLIGRRGELVSGVDLMPLILDQAGIAPPAGLSGRDPLVPGSLPHDYVRGETSHTGACYLRSLEWKWIGGTGGRVPSGIEDRFVGGTQIFDLRSDPRERTNLVWQPVAPPADLEAQRAALGDRCPIPESKDPPMTEQQLLQLRILGYVR